jgi:hypothetical protein
MQADIAEPGKTSTIDAVFAGPACKACGSTSVRRSRRSRFDRIVTAFGYLPYRCRDCRARFYLRAPSQPTGKRSRPQSRSETRARRRTTLRRELFIYALALVSFAALVFMLVRDHD